MLFVNVAIDGTGPYLDRLFTYSVPPDLASDMAVGLYVKVPWGKKQRGAIVASVSGSPPADLDPGVIKPVSSIADHRPVLGPMQWQMVDWLRRFYFGSWSAAVRCLVPGPVLQGLKKGTKARAKARTFLAETDFTGPTLTPDQARVWGVLEEKLSEGKTFLLHGVTGSGKTELYLRATASVLAQGKTALVLVPEVSLTPQTQERYRCRFGPAVSILHSGLTGAQRREQWWRIRDGSASVVVGTRSAIFAPLDNCALIVLDEEHDSSYKQSSDIRYHARQVAAWISRQNGCCVLLGSATPSLESYTLARSGRYELLELPNRISGRALPEVKVLKGNGIPHVALQALAARKSRGEQSVILLNRRGYSGYLQCQECAWVPECRDCSISLTFHHSDRSVRCHYCGAHRGAPQTCADCGGARLEYPGRGTERVEQELLTRLPELRVARLDRDTVAGRSSVFEKTFAAFDRGEYDCLLGTQMVAKGLDFPEVTLVLVLDADTGLHLPDFRAAERTFSLLTQVAGRAGRGEKPGEVLLVCRKPDQPLFRHLRSNRWIDFMAEERALRETFGYPPYCRMLRILLSDENEGKVEALSEKLGQSLQDEAAGTAVQILGPAPCPIERLQGRYRWHILLRAPRVQDLQNLVRKIRPSLELGKTRLALDPDPSDLM